MPEENLEQAVDQLALKIRLAMDCLCRAIDQLEEERATTIGWNYVADQVRRTAGYLTASAEILARWGYVAFPEPWPR